MDEGFSQILVEDPDVDSALPNGNDTEDEPTHLSCEAMQDELAVKKMPQKPRKPHQLTNDTFIINRVNDKDVPVSPLKAASVYRNAIGVIVRETVNIMCMSLRVEEQANIREELFNKLVNRYSFNLDGDNDQSIHMKKMVKHNALKMMTKALNTWQNMANSKKNENYETYVKNRWPQIQEKDWQLFVASHLDTSFKKMSEWGKGMRKKTKQDNELNNHAYLGKRKVYGKEDESMQETGMGLLMLKNDVVMQVHEKQVSL
jgi:hypothetical protein